MTTKIYLLYSDDGDTKSLITASTSLEKISKEFVKDCLFNADLSVVFSSRKPKNIKIENLSSMNGIFKTFVEIIDDEE